MSLDVDGMVKQMLAAAEVPLAKYYKSAKPAAAAEFTTIAKIVEQIGIDRATKTITAEDAQDRIMDAADASKAALATVAGLGALAAEDAVNAALNAVTSVVNGYLGLAVL